MHSASGASSEAAEPDDDEHRILDAYASGDPEDQPCMSQDELLKELCLAAN